MRGSVSPVARRGPGGQGVGRVSEPPASPGMTGTRCEGSKMGGRVRAAPVSPAGGLSTVRLSGSEVRRRYPAAMREDHDAELDAIVAMLESAGLLIQTIDEGQPALQLTPKGPGRAADGHVLRGRRLRDVQRAAGRRGG